LVAEALGQEGFFPGDAQEHDEADEQNAGQLHEPVTSEDSGACNHEQKRQIYRMADPAIGAMSDKLMVVFHLQSWREMFSGGALAPEE
jgi:hypothetical protein